MRARRVDSNHRDLREDCERLGISWLPIAPERGGEPDALLGWRGEDRLVEVKRPIGPKGGKSGRELRRNQVAWHLSWSGRPVSVVRTIQDVVALFAPEDNPRVAPVGSEHRGNAGGEIQGRR